MTAYPISTLYPRREQTGFYGATDKNGSKCKSGMKQDGFTGGDIFKLIKKNLKVFRTRRCVLTIFQEMQIPLDFARVIQNRFSGDTLLHKSPVYVICRDLSVAFYFQHPTSYIIQYFHTPSRTQ